LLITSALNCFSIAAAEKADAPAPKKEKKKHNNDGSGLVDHLIFHQIIIS
jgi:hypothetical protein